MSLRCRIDIAEINISGIVVLMLLAGLIAAATIHPPSDYRVPRISDEEKRITAYHESGHALLAANLPAGGEIMQVTIVSRWGVLGALTRAPAPNDLNDEARRARKKAELIIALGGLIAEEVILGSGEVTEAMTSDIKAAEKIAFELLGGPETGLTPAVADAGMRRLLSEAQRRARDILSSREARLHSLAAGLLRHGALNGAEVAAILEGGALQRNETKKE